jgi:MFS family permease
VPTTTAARRPGAALAVMCLAVFTVNVDTTIVNVTLPTLVAELGATTRDLQWIVDSYLLVFAALVMAGGSLSDRYGRRLVLVLGLAVFGLGNAVAAFADTPGQLVAARAFTGIGATAVFPTTLSILTQVPTAATSAPEPAAVRPALLPTR